MVYCLRKSLLVAFIVFVIECLSIWTRSTAAPDGEFVDVLNHRTGRGYI